MRKSSSKYWKKEKKLKARNKKVLRSSKEIVKRSNKSKWSTNRRWKCLTSRYRSTNLKRKRQRCFRRN